MVFSEVPICRCQRIFCIERNIKNRAGNRRIAGREVLQQMLDLMGGEFRECHNRLAIDQAHFRLHVFRFATQLFTDGGPDGRIGQIAFLDLEREL